MIETNKYDFFIFDCDGVILDSNELKTEAFANAIQDEPTDLISDFVEYHKMNGGVSRYEKFKYYFENLKNQFGSGKDIEDALIKFAAIVSNGLLKCNYIPGVMEFIVMLRNIKKRIFVVSGSDEKELIQVFSNRCILKYFEGIYGSPNNKIENTKKVLKYFDKNNNGIFFGDSNSDLVAAEEFGLDFIFVHGKTEWKAGKEIVKGKGHKVIENFLSLVN